VQKNVLNKFELITITKVNQYPNPLQISFVGPVYDINISGNNNFPEKFSISIGYDASSLTKEEMNALSIFHMSEATNEWIYEPGYVDRINNKVFSQIDHLSLFGLSFNLQCWLPDWGWIPISDSDKILCNYIDLLSKDIVKLRDNRDQYVRSLGVEQYNRVLNHLILSKDKADGLIGQNVASNVVDAMSRILDERKTTKDKLEDFYTFGNSEYCNTAYSSGEIAIDLYSYLNSLIGVIADDWLGHITGYGYVELIKNGFSIANDLFERSAGSYNSGYEVFDSFFFGGENETKDFGGNSILIPTNSSGINQTFLGVGSVLEKKFSSSISPTTLFSHIQQEQARKGVSFYETGKRDGCVSVSKRSFQASIQACAVSSAK